MNRALMAGNSNWFPEEGSQRFISRGGKFPGAAYWCKKRQDGSFSYFEYEDEYIRNLNDARREAEKTPSAAYSDPNSTFASFDELVTHVPTTITPNPPTYKAVPGAPSKRGGRSGRYSARGGRGRSTSVPHQNLNMNAPISVPVHTDSADPDKNHYSLVVCIQNMLQNHEERVMKKVEKLFQVQKDFIDTQIDELNCGLDDEFNHIHDHLDGKGVDRAEAHSEDDEFVAPDNGPDHYSADDSCDLLEEGEIDPDACANLIIHGSARPLKKRLRKRSENGRKKEKEMKKMKTKKVPGSPPKKKTKLGGNSDAPKPVEPSFEKI